MGARASPNHQVVLSDIFPKIPSDRVAALLDRLGFEQNFELDLVIPNLSAALISLRRCLSALPPSIEAMSDELETILEKYPINVLGEMATGRRSSYVSDPNPIRGRYEELPLCAAASLLIVGRVTQRDQEKFHASLGFLLLSRSVPGASLAASANEVHVADGIRKAFNNPHWESAKALIPRPGERFTESLIGIPTEKLAELPDVQQEFFWAFSKLLRNSHIGRVQPRRRSYQPLANEAPDSSNQLDDLDEAVLPASEIKIQFEPEADDEATALVELHASDLRSGQGEITAKRILVDAAHRFVRDNQFLPHHWRSLTPDEARDVASLAETLLADPFHFRVALVGTLVFLTGQHPEEISEFVLATSLDFDDPDLPWSDNFIDLTSGTWRHRGPRLRKAFRPTAAQVPYLKPHANWISLALPRGIVDALRAKYSDKSHQSVAEALSLSDQEATKLLEDFCKEIRSRSPSVRVFPARLRSQAFDWWIRQTNDDTLASLASGVTEFAPAAPLYYYAASLDDLQRLHLQRLAELGWAIEPAGANRPELQFGSHLQPSWDSLKLLIEALLHDIDAAQTAYADHQSPTTIVNLHNGLAIYTLALLIFGTGHRRAAEYSFTGETISAEHGLVVIADKIISPTNAARLVGLPELCRRQLAAYREHLNLVAARTSRYSPQMAARIRSLAQDNEATAVKIPLFGLLSDDFGEWKPIGVNHLTKHFASLWPLPWNAPRDILASETRRERLSAEFNHYRAGHIGLGQEPWSHWSPLVPTDTLTEMARIANLILARQGWLIRAGLGGRHRGPSRQERGSSTHADLPFVLAPLARARATLSPNTRALVRTALKNHGSGNPRKYSTDDVAAMREEILEKSRGNSFAASTALNLLRRWLRRHEATGKSDVKLPWLQPLNDAPVFGPDTSIDLERAAGFRVAFLEYLARNRISEPTEYAARYALALIAFAGIVKKEWLGPALRGSTAAFTADNRLWIELELRSEVDDELLEFVRRPLDPMASCLLINKRYADLLRQTLQTHPPAEILGAAEDLLKKIRAETRNSVFPLTIAEATRLFRTYFRLYLPGMLAGIGDGRANSYCLTRSDFLRVVEGCRTEVPTPVMLETSEVDTGNNVGHARNTSLIEAKRILGDVHRILLEALPPAATGGRQGSAFEAKYANALRALNEIRPDKSSSVLSLLLTWVRRLFETGGARRTRLKTSTIRTYWHRVATPLVEFAIDLDLARLDDEGFAELYSQILDSRSRRSRARRARVLRDFHHRCGAPLPELDWYEIEPDIDIDQGTVSAQIITPAEFQRIIDHLEHGEPQTGKGMTDYGKALVCSLIFQFRGGLRIGEVLGLTASDVVFSGQCVQIFVQRNRFGRPKTAAGQRIVRLSEPLLRSEERARLKDMVERRLAICGNKTDCALFGPSSDAGELYEREVFTKDIGNFLRWATGRDDARSHHLRHSAGTYQLAAVVPPPIDSKLWSQICAYVGCEDPTNAIYRLYLNDDRPSRRIVHAISAQLGHASPDSTFTYLHLLDASLSRYLWEAAPARIDDVDSLIRIKHDSDANGKVKSWRGSDYDLAESLTGLSNADLRQIKRRGTDVGHPQELAKWLIKKYPMAHGLRVLDDDTPSAAPTWGNWQVRLEHVHRVLVVGQSDVDLEQIASHTGVPITLAASLLRTAERNWRRCNYSLYKNGWGAPKVPSAATPGDPYAQFCRIIERLREPDIRDGLQVWADNYRSSQAGLVGRSSNDIVALLKLINAIGIDFKKVRISLPDKFSPDDRKWLIGDISIANIRLPETTTHQSVDSKAGSDSPILYLLLENSRGGSRRSKNMRRFHQYFYLAWILMLSLEDR